MIRVCNISFGYSKEKKILDDISLDILENSFVVLEGNSGIGKSTFLSCLAGLVKQNEGTIEVDGLSVSDPQNEKKVREKIGYLPQESCMINSLNLLENIYIPKIFEKNHEDWNMVLENARNLISKVGLEGKESNKPEELSGGEMRRAEVARLLILNNDIVIMDEPTRGMDDECVLILNRIFKELKQEKKTIVVSTHDERIITEEVDRVYQIKNGKIYESV